MEDASRFARDLVTQELGVLALIGRGVRVLTASGDDLTNTDDPFKVAMRQIAGAFAQLEKARLVAKLKGARDRKRATGVKVEGRKSYAEMRPGDGEAREAAPSISGERQAPLAAGYLPNAGAVGARCALGQAVRREVDCADGWRDRFSRSA